MVDFLNMIVIKVNINAMNPHILNIEYSCSQLSVLSYYTTDIATNDAYKVYLLGDSDYVLAIVHDIDANKFWMVSQFRYGINSELIEFIGGGKDRRENPTSAIMREIKEELGYMPKLNYNINDIKLLSQSYSYPTLSRSKTFLFYIPVKGLPT
jgi:hypothetical protein